MSASTASTATDGDVPVQPDQAFDRCIWHHPGICNNCFRKVKTVHEGPTLTLGNETTVVQETEQTETAVWGVDEIEHDAYGELATTPTRTTCAECGSVGLNADPRVLSRREALVRLDRLVKRCREEGLPVDEDLMRAVVHTAKSHPELCGQDREIFAKAVEGSIRHQR